MSTAYIIAATACVLFAGWFGYSVGRFVEKGVWSEVIATLYNEADPNEPGDRRRGTLDVVWWRRKEKDL